MAIQTAVLLKVQEISLVDLHLGKWENRSATLVWIWSTWKKGIFHLFCVSCVAKWKHYDSEASYAALNPVGVFQLWHSCACARVRDAGASAGISRLERLGHLRWFTPSAEYQNPQTGHKSVEHVSGFENGYFTRIYSPDHAGISKDVDMGEDPCAGIIIFIKAKNDTATFLLERPTNRHALHVPTGRATAPLLCLVLLFLMGLKENLRLQDTAGTQAKQRQIWGQHEAKVQLLKASKITPWVCVSVCVYLLGGWLCVWCTRSSSTQRNDKASVLLSVGFCFSTFFSCQC